MSDSGQSLQWEHFKLIDLAEVHQNGSFVEKMMVHRDGIANVCNTFSPESSNSTAVKILFEKLDMISHTAYGVFGYKSSVKKFLQGLGAWEAGLAGDNLSDGPGLYAFISTLNPALVSTDDEGTAGDDTITERHSLYMVLWPKEDAFEDIHALNKTTTFFRYLTKLCQQIFVCLDENCARDFPENRKTDDVYRFNSYTAKQEIVKDEGFLLDAGFELNFKEFRSEGHIMPRLIGGLGCAAVLTGKRVQSEKKVKKYMSVKMKLNNDGFIDIQELTNSYFVELDKMPSSERKTLFRNISIESYDLVEDLERRLQELDRKFQKDYSAKTAEIEAGTPSKAYMKDIVKFFVRTQVAGVFPDLAKKIAPALSEEQLDWRIKQSRKSADEIYEMLDCKTNWVLRKRVCLCLAYYKKNGDISADKIYDCLTIQENELKKELRPTAKHKKTFREYWRSLKSSTNKILSQGKYYPSSERDEIMVQHMEKALGLYVNDKTEQILNENACVSRKEEAKRVLYQDLISKKQKLESEALLRLWAMHFLLQSTHARLSLVSCKNAGQYLVLNGELEEDEEQRISYNVRGLTIRPSVEESLSRNRFSKINPIERNCGEFYLPASMEVINAWLIKDKLLIVSRHLDKAEAFIIAYGFRGEAQITKNLKKSVHLADVDEFCRLLAVYTQKKSDTGVLETSSFAVYHFDERFNFAETPQYNLHDKAGEAELRCMSFLQGCRKLALLDYSNRIRIYDVVGKNVQQQSIQLDTGISPLRMFSLDMGMFLMVLCQTEGVEGVRVYPFISPSYEALPPVNINSKCRGTWEVFAFGKERQPHLCLLDNEGLVLTSRTIVATGREKALNFTETDSLHVNLSEDSSEIKMTPLEYIFFVYDKFPVQGEAKLKSSPANPKMTVLFDCELDLFDGNKLETRTKEYMDSIWESLEEGHKPLKGLQLTDTLTVIRLNSYQRSGGDNGYTTDSSLPSQRTGEWVRQLICLVPLQIARAEDNNFHVLTDGIPLSEENALTVQACADHTNLGVYDSILRWWPGKVVVISSMGKQSTGKSYTLNHLFGLSFEISGARCTDGCWMTLCEGQGDNGGEGILYVVLDFEGLGSFERSEQEDMLLSVFNAALSGLTIFKTGPALDRDTEHMFARFQAGVGKFKGDERLFKGRFCIVSRDVPARDIKPVAREFESKLRQLMQEGSGSNFISEMYNNTFDIFPFPPLGETKYYTNLRIFDKCIRENLKACQFVNGISFADCMKTIMAKMKLKDWHSLERMEIERRLHYLEAHLETALHIGRADADDFAKEELRLLDTNVMVDEEPLQCFLNEGSRETNIEDGLETIQDVSITIPVGGSFFFVDADVFLNKLFNIYERLGCVRTGKEHGIWHRKFADFVAAVCRRRVTRVMKWVKGNLDRFGNQTGETADVGEGAVPHKDGEAANFIHQAKIRADKLCESLEVCTSVCTDCHLLCISPKNHPSVRHSCMGDHKCRELCWFCQNNESNSVCGGKSGHSGEHDCRKEDHTCIQPCDLKDCSNCNVVCAGKVGHEKFMIPGVPGKGHLCSAKTHLCGQKCSASGCRSVCGIAYGLTHTVHKCVAGSCTHKCDVADCEQMCAAPDHFHLSPDSEKFREETGVVLPEGIDKFGKHFCGRYHLCSESCESQGICKVSTQRVQGAFEYSGRRSNFSYARGSVASGEKMVCSVKIPPFEIEHKGPHRHSLDPLVVHYCDQRCPTCFYFCEQPFGHKGRHHGAHGMMRDCYFVSDSEEIDIGPRKYTVGESGKAEMCDMFCRSLGRGHIHLLPCDAEPNSRCAHSPKDGRQHQTCQYIGRPEDGSVGTNELDELTHETYWKTINWEDPCYVREREDFAKCGYSCGDDSHSVDGEEPSFCSLDLWHPLDTKTPDEAAFVSSDGHLFHCRTHASGVKGKCHLVFVLDESFSMRGAPWKELQAAVNGFVSTRLQDNQIYDIISIIQYSSAARVIAEAAPITSLIHRDLRMLGHGTDFSKALEAAHGILDRTSTRYPQYQPMLLFLSDGKSVSDGKPEMYRLKVDFKGKILLYTVAFGKKAKEDTLKGLAMIGGGEFIQSMDGIKLKDSFEEVASRLQNRIALMAEQGSKPRLGCKPPTVFHEQIHKIPAKRSATAEESCRKKAETEVANILKKTKTLERFLAEIGFPVKEGKVKTALMGAKLKYHPDRTVFASMQDRVYGEEVMKVLNGQWAASRRNLYGSYYQ